MLLPPVFVPADEVFAEGHAPVPNSVFLAKPFSLSDLTTLVVRQLDLSAVAGDEA